MLGILVFHSAELSGRVGFGLSGRAAEVFGSVVPTLFFVISGFLLYRPFVQARATGRAAPSTGRYARRRALRILPAYLSALTILAIWPGITGPFSGDWWRYYGYLQLYSQRTVSGGIPVAWTLCVEMSFYIALPIWALAVRRSSRVDTLIRSELAPLAIAAAAGILVQLAVARHAVSYLLGSSIAGQCTWLCLGMALAVLSVAGRQDRGRFGALHTLGEHPGRCWIGSAVALAGLMALVPRGGVYALIAIVHTKQSLGATLARTVLSGALVTLLVLPAIFGEPGEGVPRRVLGSRALVGLGVISYSFYLYHLTISELIAWGRAPAAFSASGLNLLAHLHTARTIVLFLVSLAATIVVAAVSYRVVELPLLRRKET